MNLQVIIFDLVAAAGVLFVSNWLGKQAISYGYEQVSFSDNTEEAPLVDRVYKIAFPSALMLVLGWALHRAGRFDLARNIWVVVPAAALLRVAHSATWRRLRLMDWKNFAINAAASTGLAFFLYRELMTDFGKILPDKATFANEIWLLVIVFIFELFNRKQPYADARHARRVAYISRRYSELKDSYRAAVEKRGQSSEFNRLVYSIMIVESFNRPPLVRAIERVRGKRNGTYGVMQVRSLRPLTDAESVDKGLDLLTDLHAKIRQFSPDPLPGTWGDETFERHAVKRMARLYNGHSTYVDDVMGVYAVLEGVDAELEADTASRADDENMKYNICCPL